MTSKKKEILKQIEFYACLQEFCRHTSIPWFKCYFDPRFSYCERIFMTAILSMIFVYTAIMVYPICSNIFSYSLTTNIESLQHPTWQQPFPAVYVCPLNRISKDRIVKQVDKWILPQNITKEEMLEILKPIILGAFRLADFKDSEIIAHTMAMNNVSLIHLMNEITVPCEQMIGYCKWKLITIDCGKIFTKVFRPDGICCVFNYNYPQQNRNISLKAKTMIGSSFNSALKISLFINDSDSFSTLSSSQGYSIFIGDPDSYVDGRSLGRMLRRSSSNFYSFTSTRLERSKAVERLPVNYKGCSGPEHNLAAFRTYTMPNCKAECILNMTLKLCQCVPIIYRRYSDDQRYCEVSDLKCLTTTKGNLKQNFTQYCDVYIFSQGNMLTKIITDVRYETTELMGFIGSIVSFTMGWSIICVIEILHVLLQLAINYCINKIEEARGK